MKPTTKGIMDFPIVDDDEPEPVATAPAPSIPRRALFDFALVPDRDSSILLGNRYLNRGDGMVIVSTSGMGKSALSLQMAIELSLGRPAFGIQPNGALRSLVIQSEDSDGDVAEVAHSVAHCLKLTPEQRQTVGQNVQIVSDRVNRGLLFIRQLGLHIAEFKPDLVWINPLQAFIKGDVTESKDLGEFLREQLNSLNSEAKFGYVLVHHTTKPSTAKDKKTPNWNEIMYDMAGGAEIINWARAVISLRATETEGHFNMILAKRGRRAGVVMPSETGNTLIPSTVIPLKHATGRMDVPGMAKGLPLIFWEPREPDPEPVSKSEAGKLGGRPPKFEFADYANVIPAKTAQALSLSQLHRYCDANRPISKPSLHEALKRWEKEGLVECLRPSGQPAAYRKAF